MTYAVRIRAAGGSISGVTVTAAVRPGNGATARFTVCPLAGRSTCTLGAVAAGQTDRVQVRVTEHGAAAGTSLTLTLTASGKNVRPAAAAASMTVASSPTPSPSPGSPSTGAPAPILVPTATATPSPSPARGRKSHQAATPVSAPATTRAGTQQAVPPASDAAGGKDAGGTDPARIAVFAALLSGLALIAGNRLRLSIHRRAHPPRHADQTIRRTALLPSRGQHRLPRSGVDWPM